MTRLCLIRHGQTDWNLEGRYQGQSDVPLNEKGRQQARSLAGQLQDQPLSAIYASDLQRATETAELIARALKLKVQLDPRLREINQGEWEGQLVTTIQQRYEKLWQQRTVDPASVRPPGGETVIEVARRVFQAVDDITRNHHDGPVAIVSHGLSLATLICKARGIPLGKAYTTIPDNATPYWIDWEG